MSRGRILAIDYGRARHGLAMSDPNRIVASPFATIPAKGGPKAIFKAVEDKEIGLIVVGLPLLLNGEKGEMALEVEVFVGKLKAETDIPIQLWDERLTSAQAERHLRTSGLNRKKRAKASDEAAAIIILQRFMEANP